MENAVEGQCLILVGRSLAWYCLGVIQITIWFGVWGNGLHVIWLDPEYKLASL